MQARAVLSCHPLFDCLFFLPEPVSCRGLRIARSGGKRNRSFTKNITTFAAVVEVLILIAMFFLPFFFKYCNSKHLCAPHGASIHRPKCIWAIENCQKKNGYYFMKNCNASTHQPAHRKICLTLSHVHRHALPFYFFLSTFNTSKHIFIDFVVLLHWTTQQNKSASLRFGLTWQFFKKNNKKIKIKKRKHGKVCQAHVVSCCPAILLFVFLFFFHIIQTKKREEKGPKAIFEKEWPKIMYVVMLSRKLNRCCPRSIRLKGYSCKLMMLFCTFTIIHPACLLPTPANQVAWHSLNCSGPNMRWSWVISSAASYNQMNKKWYKCVDYELQKAQHGHKDVFPVTLSFMQKSDLQTGHLSEDRSRSFAWNLE